MTDIAEHALDTAVDASTGLYADGVALTGEIMNETVAVGRTIVNSSIGTLLAPLCHSLRSSYFLLSMYIFLSVCAFV